MAYKEVMIVCESCHYGYPEKEESSIKKCQICGVETCSNCAEFIYFNGDHT
jgi:hypothetical protein